jgi:hypothetical protein
MVYLISCIYDIYIYTSQEKADDIRQEKERRERGQKMEQTQEDRAKAQRKRDADKVGGICHMSLS